MKVGLVLPCQESETSTPTSASGAEHLGLGSLAAYLRIYGHEVTIFNFQVDAALEGKKPNREVSVNKLLDIKPDLVGVSVTGLTIIDAIDFCNAIRQKRPDLHICWGSHQASSNAADILANESCVDTIIAGDGEIPLLKLVEVIEKEKLSVKQQALCLTNSDNIFLEKIFSSPKHPLADVPGIWYRQDNKPVFSLKPLEPDIVGFPFPARDTLAKIKEKIPYVSDARIYTSRGCPFKCSFCVYPALGYLDRWRPRNADSIVDELKFLKHNYDIDHFWFSDDNFLISSNKGRQRVVDIAKGLIEANLGITYRVLMRADSVANQGEILELLAQSGLVCAYFGIESGSPRRLEYFDKHANVEDYFNAIKLVRSAGIGLQIGFIMFDPLTSWEDIEIDAFFLSEIDEMYLYTNFSQVLNLYAGTPVEKTLKEKGLVKASFDYRSDYRDYCYEDEDVGEFAKSVEAAYSGDLVSTDNFFRRLRMVDIPALYRSNKGEWVLDLDKNIESIINRLSRESLTFFLEMIELGKMGSPRKEISNKVNRHLKYRLDVKQAIISEFTQYPQEYIKNMSCYKGLGKY